MAVGHISDPLAFTPLDLYEWNHRFDDARRRFRALYCAENPRTSLREVLAEFRPNAAAIRDFRDVFGEGAIADLAVHPVSASWREQHVMAPARVQLDGPIIDLHDLTVRHDLERRHATLLAEHGLEHLDLHEITSRRRIVTQTIAGDLFDRLGAAAVRYPSRLDGNPALAVFEGRGKLVASGEPIALTDPASPPLTAVCVSGNWTWRRRERRVAGAREQRRAGSRSRTRCREARGHLALARFFFLSFATRATI
ncbi:MAG TPA: RES domain-containing protein [Polyangia bacterium]|nr:RES domain-containing protein [Polyangia bacterium]